MRDIREGEEAELALLLEEEAMLRRHEKVERLRLAWKKRMEHQKYEGMMRELSKLSLEELDKDMETIELLVTKLMIDEAGAYTGKHNIISMDDVEMCEAAKHNPNKPIIIWADELMDTVTKDTEGYMHGEYMMEGDSMMNNFTQGDMKKDTLPEGVEMMPEGEVGMEVALSRSMGKKPDELESVVGVERLQHYPHHCGGGHTQLLSPATITENGVELGCVTGWPITGEHLAHRILDMEMGATHIPLH